MAQTLVFTYSLGDKINENLQENTQLVFNEVCSCMANWPAFNSAHEGFAVMKEEVDELWEHVKTNQRKRDIVAMKKEAIQVAAMAIRFATDCCDEVTGRK